MGSLHGLQDGRGGSLGRHRRGDLLRVGPLRLPLDHPLPQHRRDAHRGGQRPSGHAGLYSAGPVGGFPRLPRVRGPDHLPQPLARRLVACPGHRGPPDHRLPLTPGVGGQASGNGSQERLQQVQSADSAGAGRRDQGLCHPRRPARSPHHGQAGEQASGAGGHRGAGPGRVRA